MYPLSVSFPVRRPMTVSYSPDAMTTITLLDRDGTNLCEQPTLPSPLVRFDKVDGADVPQS